MTKYVCGFYFDKTNRFVVLIKKNRPNYQVGKLNGVGGHVEENELPIYAMQREFQEETGVDTRWDSWKNFLVLKSTDARDFSAFEIHFYFNEGDVEEAKTKTDEEISVYAVHDIIGGVFKTMGNLKWLILMALAVKRGEENCILFEATETRPRPVQESPLGNQTQ